MPSTVDEFLRTLPTGTPIEVETLAYGVRQVVGAYAGRAPGEPDSIVIEDAARHVVALGRVEAVRCPVSGPGAAEQRLEQSVPRQATVVVSTSDGAAVRGTFQGIAQEPRQVELHGEGGTKQVPLDDVVGIALERT